MTTGASPLGKGLNALLPTDIDIEDKKSSTGEYFQCPAYKISANPNQPRQEMDDQRLEELAESIRAKGIIQPLLVRETENGYELIAGERRLRAARIVGLDQVPVVVRDSDLKDSLELALVENIQRQNLNPIEEAAAYRQLGKEFSLTQDEIAARVGKERSTVANSMRLLQLPEYVQKDIRSGVLSMGHGRVLLSLKDDEVIRMLRDAVIDGKLSVRQSEQLAKKLKKKKPIRQKRNAGKPIPRSYCRTLSNEFVKYLGNKSRIVQQGDRGKIVIEYYSLDDLERLHKLILSKEKGE